MRLGLLLLKALISLQIIATRCSVLLTMQARCFLRSPILSNIFDQHLQV
jgi:hypothetical protein